MKKLDKLGRTYKGHSRAMFERYCVVCNTFFRTRVQRKLTCTVPCSNKRKVNSIKRKRTEYYKTFVELRNRGRLLLDTMLKQKYKHLYEVVKERPSGRMYINNKTLTEWKEHLDMFEKELQNENS